MKMGSIHSKVVTVQLNDAIPTFFFLSFSELRDCQKQREMENSIRERATRREVKYVGRRLAHQRPPP